VARPVNDYGRVLRRTRVAHADDIEAAVAQVVHRAACHAAFTGCVEHFHFDADAGGHDAHGVAVDA